MGADEARGSGHNESQEFSLLTIVANTAGFSPPPIVPAGSSTCATLASYGSTFLDGNRCVSGPSGGFRLRLLVSFPQSLARHLGIEERSRLSHPTRPTPR